jgi:hypothetical protein
MHIPLLLSRRQIAVACIEPSFQRAMWNFHSLILYVVSRRLPPADVSTRRCRQSTQKKMTWRRQKYLLVLAESPGLRRALPSSAHRTDIVPQIKTHAATFKDFSG